MYLRIGLASILTLISSPVVLAQSEADILLAHMIEAYGGEARLEAIRSIEFETVGYFHGRNQSRHTEPPWDRMPIRQFTAVDFDADRGARDVLSAWPGGLTMGYRTIIDGERRFHLNTIAQIYETGSMGGVDALRGSARIRFPGLYLLTLRDNPDEIQNVRHETIDSMEFIAFDNGAGRTTYVYPESYLIHSTQWSIVDHMSGRETAYRRIYNDYMDIDGMVFPQRYLMFVEGLPYYDLSLPHIALNPDISAYLEIPDGFEPVEDTDGYSGNPEISVRQIADGVYAAGGGEIQVLYVEFDDYWVAMETGNFPDYAENTHRAMMPYMNDKPLRYIIPTHYHDDHLVGVYYYSWIGATILTTRDKEGYIRTLLSRSYGENGGVENPVFEFIDGEVYTFEDATNRLDVHVYADAPHTENMLVGYVHDAGVLFSGDTVIGWAQPVAGQVRQGATFAALHLQDWIEDRQAEGAIREIHEYMNVHGLPYSPDEWRQLLSQERVFVTLPDDSARPVASWFLEYGLIDDTVHNARRDYLPDVPTTH
jgi:glyoxylase-like metal-dependent hydrolase (beta-lactamase superfamily II)